MAIRLLFLIALLLLLASGFSQQNHEITYTVDDGLPSNMVYSIEQDERGFMWFGTDSGLSRFDGYEFINYSLADGLPDTEILNFFKDSKSRIWFYTLNGKVGYVKDDSIYNSSNTEWLKELNFNGRITSIVEHDNLIYFTALTSVIKVLKEKQVSIIDTEPESYETFSICLCNNKLMAVSSRKILTLENNRVTSKIMINPYSELIYPQCYQDKIYTFVRSIKNPTMVIIDEGKVKNIPMSNENRILNMKKKNNELLILRESGIFRLSKTNPYQLEKCRSLELASSTFKDAENNTWYSSLSKGLSLDVEVELLKKEKVINATALYQNEEYLFIGHEGNSISRYDAKKNTFETLAHLNSINPINSIDVDSNGVVWFCRSDRIYSRQGEQFSSKGAKKIGSYEDFLFTGRNSAFVIHNLTNNTNKTIDQYDVLDMIIFNQDSVLLGTGNGLVLYTGGEVKKTFSHPLLKTRIHQMTFDEKGDLWLATGGNGLLKRDRHGFITQISTQENLSSDICTSLVVSDSVMWAVTSKGLNKLSFDSSGYKISVIDQSNGLSSYQVNDIVWHGDSLYLAQNDGLYAFSDKIKLTEPNTFKIFIDKVLIDGKEAFSNLFKHTISSIQITFKALTYRNHKSLNYQYQLTSNNTAPLPSTNWLNTNFNAVTFSSLNPGSYSLWIRAKTKNSDWTKPFEYSFEIRPAFWQTLYFQISTSLLALFLIFIGTRFFYKNRESKKDLARAKLSAEIKALKAQINPHFLFNGLNSIQAFILQGDLKNSEEYLSKYGLLMRRILAHSEKLTTRIEDELETIRLYADLEKIRIENDFELVIDIQSSIDIKKQRIPSMIIQPFVENAIWHGITPMNEKGQIEICINDLNKNIEIMISDNGVGFDTGQVQSEIRRKSYGVKLVAERLELINTLYNQTSEFKISSQPGNGTKVVMQFPQNLD